MDRGPEQFRELVDHSPAMIWRSGTDMLCDYFSRSWLDFTGRSIEQELGMGWAEGVHPDDYDRCVETYVSAFRAREPFSMDYRLRRHDGTYRWVHDQGAPLERDGVFAGYLGSCMDIEEHKRLEAGQRRLLEETNHRVKNMLASVQAIAYQTFRGEAEPKAAYAAFLGRLQAMAAAHDLVSSEHAGGVELAALAGHAARPYAEDAARLRLEGEPVRIAPKRAMSLALCLHELFSNAVRHGALSGGAGEVALRWQVEPKRIRLRWEERGGPPVPDRRGSGFGLRLIETLGREGGGEVRFAFAPEGFACEIDLARANPEQPAGERPPAR